MTDSYVPVALKSLRVDSQLPFDLYLMTSFSEDHSLFCESDRTFSREDYERARDLDLDDFLVPEEQREALYAYCAERVTEVVNDESIAPEEKAQIIYSSGAAIVQDLFSHPNCVPRIDQAKGVIREAVRYIVDDREATESMLFMTHHDYYTYTHSMNVAIYGVALAERIFGTKAIDHDLARLGEGFLLHDIGKSRISTDIIQSPNKLTNEEWAEMKRHPQLGYRILAEAGRLDEMIMPIVLEHHEKINGKGYPAGLVGDEIHVHARVCAVADVFDALTTIRTYRRGMKTYEALSVMSEEMPGHFQPEFLAEFVQMFAQ